MVNIFSLTELKNGSDDFIPVALQKLGYTQNHSLLDTRLALGYLGVVAAALAGAYDYRVGFEKAKGFTLAGVLVYFIFYGAMNFWQFFIESGTVYKGSKGDLEITIKTSTEKTSPTYSTRISLHTAAGTADVEVSRHELFTKWFDCDGNIVTEPLSTWLSLLVSEAEKQLDTIKGKKNR